MKVRGRMNNIIFTTKYQPLCCLQAIQCQTNLKSCKIRIYFIESSLHTVPGPIRPSRRTTAAMKTKNPFDGRPYQLNIGKEVTFLGPRSSF